jgi:hypothetical protein
VFLVKDEREPCRTTVLLVNAPAFGEIPAIKELDVNRDAFQNFASKGQEGSGEEPSRPPESLCALADLIERNPPPHGYELHVFTPSQTNVVVGKPFTRGFFTSGDCSRKKRAGSSINHSAGG